ncbi:MAG: FGGY-family carbohydrate kinase [Bacteroidia bacterium]
MPHIAIFDIGKTNKKFLVFDEGYRLVHAVRTELPETTDEAGFPAEDLHALTAWMDDTLAGALADPSLDIRALNFSAYGATWVCIDAAGQPLTPVYSYLKPLPQPVHAAFWGQHDPDGDLALRTASPDLGFLNAGMQLFWLGMEQPEVFARIDRALFLPQYLSYRYTGQPLTEYTGVGCHTLLWDLGQRAYAPWVAASGVGERLGWPAPTTTAQAVWLHGRRLLVGGGIHDSSAALLSFRRSGGQPFVLLSTGTWCIALNPFDETPLTAAALADDGLCYLDDQGRAVKAARLFLGEEYRVQTARLAAHFGRDADAHRQVQPDAALLAAVREAPAFVPQCIDTVAGLRSLRAQPPNDLRAFASYEAAYHRLMTDLVGWQVYSLRQVLGTARQVLVTGGFCDNALYLHLLAAALPGVSVAVSRLAEASALGAALLLHEQWLPTGAALPDLAATPVRQPGA